MAGSPEQQSSSSKIDQLLNQLTVEVRRTIRNADRSQVHDLRVASRRFGQAVAVLGDAPGVAKIRRRLKKMVNLAGAVRDYDITSDLIAKLDVAARLKARLRTRRREAQAELVIALRHWAERGSEAKWRSKLSGDPDALAAGEHQTLVQAAQRLFDRAAKLNHSARTLHKLRIAAKKLRYTMELLLVGPARLDPIKKLQSKLGTINDHESARRIVAKEGASRTLIEDLEAAQEKRTRQFRRYWKREFAGKEKAWLEILTHPANTHPTNTEDTPAA
jgi:CHAD domain-containing protein